MKKIKIRCLILLLTAMAIELFIFNFRSFESMTFSDMDTFSMAAADQTPLKKGQDITFSQDSDGVLILDQIHETVHNLYLNVTCTQDPSRLLTVCVQARDEGNNQYYSLPEMKITPHDERSKYIKMNLSGKAESIKITFKDTAGKTLTVYDVGLNRYRPLDFSVLRLAAIFLGLLAIYAFRPGSSIYTIPYAMESHGQRVFITILLFAQLAAAAGVTLGNPDYCNPRWVHHSQYHQLAVALSEGHFDLDIQPSPELLQMENPYDKYERDAKNVDFQWDTAFYDGKYYSYFGILPVLVYYLPYYLITGQAFFTVVGIVINSAFIIAGVFFLLHVLVKKYFKNVSLGLFVMLECMLLLGSGFLLIVNPPSFYNMPVSMAVALTLWGLYFWVRAVKDETFIDRRFLAAGAVCMALVAACRPQVVAGSFLIIPIFWKPFKACLKKSKKEAVVHLVTAAIPYVIVAALLMYYNFARFGSPFDFGANYNLTTNDMTHRGFHIDRLPFGLFTYLFQPINLVGRFPFMSSVRLSTSYQGATIAETMYGGFLWFNLITLALLFWGNVKMLLKKKGLSSVCLLSLVLALIIICADVEMAGILQRYGCDFGLFLTLPSVLVALGLHEKAVLYDEGKGHGQKGNAQKVYNKGRFKVRGLQKLFLKVLVWGFGLTCLVNILWLMAK